MQRSSVDLPDPERPKMTTTSPRETAMSMQVSTSTSPKSLHSCSTLTIGGEPGIASTAVMVIRPPSRRARSG